VQTQSVTRRQCWRATEQPPRGSLRSAGQPVKGRLASLCRYIISRLASRTHEGAGFAEHRTSSPEKGVQPLLRWVPTRTTAAVIVARIVEGLSWLRRCALELSQRAFRARGNPRTRSHRCVDSAVHSTLRSCLAALHWRARALQCFASCGCTGMCCGCAGSPSPR
jgi:hypothetical protein